MPVIELKSLELQARWLRECNQYETLTILAQMRMDDLLTGIMTIFMENPEGDLKPEILKTLQDEWEVVDLLTTGTVTVFLDRGGPLYGFMTLERAAGDTKLVKLVLQVFQRAVNIPRGKKEANSAFIKPEYLNKILQGLVKVKDDATLSEDYLRILKSIANLGYSAYSSPDLLATYKALPDIEVLAPVFQNIQEQIESMKQCTSIANAEHLSTLIEILELCDTEKATAESLIRIFTKIVPQTCEYRQSGIDYVVVIADVMRTSDTLTQMLRFLGSEKQKISQLTCGILGYLLECPADHEVFSSVTRKEIAEKMAAAVKGWSEDVEEAYGCETPERCLPWLANNEPNNFGLQHYVAWVMRFRLKKDLEKWSQIIQENYFATMDHGGKLYNGLETLKQLLKDGTSFQGDGRSLVEDILNMEMPPKKKPEPVKPKSTGLSW